MASDNKCSTGNEFIKVMETFPCLFNIGMMKKPNHLRLSLMIKSLKEDIQGEGEDYEAQRVEELNVLSWLHFQVGDLDEAKAKNDDAICIDTDDLVTLGNRAFLEWYSGSPLSTFLDHLEKIKLHADFPEKKLNAKSAQAKLLFRLGGVYNMSSSVPMYNDLLKTRPENFEWKYWLCLARRRLMVMVRNNQDENEIEQLYRDIAENAAHSFFKSAAMCELAILLASKNESVRVVEDLVERALALSGNLPKVLRQCGMALTRQSNPRGINLLEKSLSLKVSTVTQHSLAKALVNPRLTRQMDRKGCDRKAALNFQASYDSSFQENVRPLVDLGFMHLSRNRYNESLVIYRGLVQNWMVKEVYQNPFTLSKLLDGWYQSMKKTGVKRMDPHFERYISITISAALEQFKRNASPIEKASIFDLIVKPGMMACRDRSMKFLLDLMRDCVSDYSAVQILMRLALQGRLGDKNSIEKEAELLMEKDRPGEALLMLDIAELQENSHLDFSRRLRVQAMLQEAKWQLSQGLISCKLLFYKIFNLRHSHPPLRQEREIEDEDDKTSPEADVLIFQDGHHWKPFLQDNSDQSTSNESFLGFVNQNRMIEDILINLFDLETITNPWLPFSGENRPDTEEFSALLRNLKVRLVLLVVDPETSNGFLQMADFLLSKTCQAKDTDLAIVYTKGADEVAAKSQIPNLASSIRSFKADESGFQYHADSKPVTELVGTEITDAYFSGRVENVMDFFKFLAPGE